MLETVDASINDVLTAKETIGIVMDMMYLGYEARGKEAYEAATLVAKELEKVPELADEGVVILPVKDDTHIFVLEVVSKPPPKLWG